MRCKFLIDYAVAGHWYRKGDIGEVPHVRALRLASRGVVELLGDETTTGKSGKEKAVRAKPVKR